MSEYDRASIMAQICDLIAEGKALKDICALEGMPTRSTIYEWLNDASIADMYARAREERADLFADEITQIADECTDPAKARLQVDARKWAAAKLNPKRYSDKVVNEHSGPDGKPIETKFVLEFVKSDVRPAS